MRLDRAADTLAEAVRLQWEAEAGLRELRQPAPLQLRWETTDRPVAVPIASVAGGAIPGRVVRLRGHLDQVADRYLALPDQRLVVLGEPGAGKTVLALLLTLELLKRPARRVGRWRCWWGWRRGIRPAEHLHSWLARRLTEDYPALSTPASDRMPRWSWSPAGGSCRSWTAWTSCPSRSAPTRSLRWSGPGPIGR